MPSFPVLSVELTEAEREQLGSWSRRLTTAQALAQRSRIVLRSIAEQQGDRVAALLLASRPVAFCRLGGHDGLTAPRPDLALEAVCIHPPTHRWH